MPTTKRPGIRTKPLGFRTRQQLQRVAKKHPHGLRAFVAKLLAPLYARIRSLAARGMHVGR